MKKIVFFIFKFIHVTISIKREKDIKIKDELRCENDNVPSFRD